ncbi:MAG: metal-binding protein ZinT [Synechococcales cyanobacterium RU_4_20]|nr:metal-binding protein ZinT [Synechococcales cyanobacterium RU_4_20]NJR67629.1 metal-binding protein ZinT [Synechococcales cyanobacterium CRU_2_2]
MNRLILGLTLMISSIMVAGCQPPDSTAIAPTTNPPAATTPTPTTPTLATPLPSLAPPIAPQVISPNAYKVPYLGFNGMFMLNADQASSVNDPRNPKRIGISKMEQITFYKDATGKDAIARNCEYVYMGAAGDPKYYVEFKATWEMFELAQDEKQDPACKKFQYLVLTAPHGEPTHMHMRYGDQVSSFAVLLKMSNEAEDAATFNPWFATYCGAGKTRCGEG